MMLQRVCYFLVVLILVMNAESFAQPSNQSIGKDIRSKSGLKLNLIHNQNAPLLSGIQAQDKIIPSSISLKIIPTNYYVSNLGFFCKKELQLDKITKVPLRFRLGSLNYVNYLEQKPNAKLIQ